MMRENCDANVVREESGNDVIGGRSELTVPVSPGGGGGVVIGVIVVEDIISQ